MLSISDKLSIDISSDGNIYVIELLNADEQPGMMQGKPFTFINEADNKKTEVQLG
jgi:hypothetical protein